MAIEATEIESIHGAVGQQRMIFYRCQDSEGVWHLYGPVVTTDDGFDVEAHKTVVADRVAETLAVAEFEEIVGTV